MPWSRSLIHLCDDIYCHTHLNFLFCSEAEGWETRGAVWAVICRAAEMRKKGKREREHLQEVYFSNLPGMTAAPKENSSACAESCCTMCHFTLIMQILILSHAVSKGNPERNRCYLFNRSRKPNTSWCCGVDIASWVHQRTHKRGSLCVVCPTNRGESGSLPRAYNTS